VERQPHVERAVVKSEVKRLDVIADDVVEDRHLRPAALVFAASLRLTGGGRA
jgi:hypothetical protein